MLFHENPNIFILFLLPKKLEIPNSKKVNRNPGCTAIILHRITTLSSMPLFVHKVHHLLGRQYMRSTTHI